LLRHAAEVALAAARPPGTDAPTHTAGAPVVVVLGADASRMRAELADLDVQVVVNPRWQEGLSTSIDAALTMLEATAGVEAVLFTTCDQPRVTSELLRELIGVYAGTRLRIVACAYAGTLGVPALFDRSLFPELRALRGDAGAKRIVEGHLGLAARIPFPDGALDIDTADDARRLASDRDEP